LKNVVPQQYRVRKKRMDLPRRFRYSAAMESTATLIDRARAYLDARRGERTTLEELGRAVGASPFHLQRSFKRTLGLSPRDYQQALKLEDTKRALAEGSRVTDAVFGAGYGSLSRFYEKAASGLGMAAKAYRAKGKGLAIVYATFPSPLGCILLAATERGLCSVKLGDTPEGLAKLLAAEFSEAEIREDRRALKDIRERVLGFLSGDGTLTKLPLDIRGTVFQQRVWAQLRQIPRGETRTYKEIATAIGAPLAVRAVGSACGANPVALVIPCHRALRTGGALGGYAWGLARKENLLKLERKRRG
jgi:AraC family transcriptional regulator, regulatory protein of adaptative response / methylated-DNA-[protein]-cysteine methyltransferase